jgi:hypothetical protein
MNNYAKLNTHWLLLAILYHTGNPQPKHSSANTDSTMVFLFVEVFTEFHIRFTEEFKIRFSIVPTAHINLDMPYSTKC